MRSPIIAATGQVRTEIPANRASFSAQFTALDPDLAAASRQAADKVRVLAKALQAYGPEKVQVQTSLSITPIYQQYRDKDGNLQSNVRADRIDRYQAGIAFRVELRDLGLLERVYAQTVSAHPSSTQPVSFTLEPSNDTNTELFKAATADAARRARLAAEAAGATLGKVMLIDPSGMACETNVLVAGAGRTQGEDAGGLQEVVVTGSRFAAAAPPPPPPPPGQDVAPADLLPLQPPLERLLRRVCVIYALN
jgi:uncharacterized protein YggE